MRKLNAGLIALAVSLVLAPTAVIAATGSFSSSSSGTALGVSNSSTGRAISATSKSGYTGRFAKSATSGSIAAIYATTASADSGAPAIYGRAISTGALSPIGVLGQSDASGGRGIYGYATKTTGANYGVWGKTASSNTSAAGVYGTAINASGSPVGVWGNSNGATGAGVYGFGHFGVQGQSAAIGDGTYGVASVTDAGFAGHLMARDGNVAGTCVIPSGTTSNATPCAFPNAFAAAPLVVAIPTSSISAVGGNSFWVTTTTTGITLHLAALPSVAGDVTFNYIAIGIDSTLPTP